MRSSSLRQHVISYSHQADKTRDDTKTNNKHVHVWMDGSFDMLHIGHILAMYQARALGDVLVVGAQSDADVKAHKGPPVYPEQERFRLIQALSCVDHFVGAASYGTTVETLNRHGCDFCVHGDDASLKASDSDPVKKLISINRAKLVARSIKASTTSNIELVLERTDSSSLKDNCMQADGLSSHIEDHTLSLHGFDATNMMAASHIRHFMDTKILRREDVIVYVDGAFDLFHVGHLSFLEKAAQQGTYLLVGVHTDRAVAVRKGAIFPIRSLMERGLIANSLKCVCDVIFGAPTVITEEMIDTFKIDVVCHGKASGQDDPSLQNRYAVPMKKGILRFIDSGSDITTTSIISRIVGRRAEYVARNAKKLEQANAAAEKLRQL